MLAQIFFEQMDVEPNENGETPKGYLTEKEFVKGLQVNCNMGDVVDAAELEQWFKEADTSKDNTIK